MKNLHYTRKGPGRTHNYKPNLEKLRDGEFKEPYLNKIGRKAVRKQITKRI